MQRVTFQLKCPNPLFESWLRELQSESTGKPGEEKYRKALDSLRKYPLVLNSGSECTILEGFTKNLCMILDRKLAKHNTQKTPIEKKSDSPIKTITDKEEIIEITPENNVVNDVIMDKIDSTDFQIFKRGSFDVYLLVDKQETNGKTKQSEVTTKGLDNFKNTKYELCHLKVGDFLWIARHKTTGEELVLPYIVERKRMDDLDKSIKDGRFHEQKFRLKQCGLPNIIYLIETYKERMYTSIQRSTLMQAVANTRIQNGFMTHFTDSLADSMKFLAMMTKHLTDHFSDKDLHRCSKDNISNITNLCDVIPLMSFEDFNMNSAKNKTLDASDLFIKQLLQLKGLSIEKALAIATFYKTPLNLMKAYERLDEKGGETLLQNLTFNGKRCNVSPSLSKILYKYFTSEALT